MGATRRRGLVGESSGGSAVENPIRKELLLAGGGAGRGAGRGADRNAGLGLLWYGRI